MLPSEYLPLWREYVAGFGELLEPALRDPGFPAAQRLVRARHLAFRWSPATSLPAGTDT